MPNHIDKIPFNKPYLTGRETEYIRQAVSMGKISGNGTFTKKCQHFFEERYGFNKCLMTTSCTVALEMAAILLDVQPGDEVIVPSYTFVSTANAFVLRGAKIVFADSYPDHPNVDPRGIEDLISPRTKAIVVVHYAGMACDMDAIMEIANRHHVKVVEDAAHAIESTYKGKPLGGIGHLGTFSFHETKNIISGEGGMLVINDPSFEERAEIVWEKGTDRAAFFRGDVNYYSWKDIGSSFLPSEIVSAFLYAQLEQIDAIQSKRHHIWDLYEQSLNEYSVFNTPVIPSGSSGNAHMFYLTFNAPDQRDDFMTFLNEHGVNAVSHYRALHQSTFYRDKHDGRELPQSCAFADKLVRLPLFFELEDQDIQRVVKTIQEAVERIEVSK